MENKYNQLLADLLKDIKDETLFLNKTDLNSLNELINKIEVKGGMYEKLQN